MKPTYRCILILRTINVGLCLRIIFRVKWSVTEKVKRVPRQHCAPTLGPFFCPLAPWAPVNTSKTCATLVNSVNTSAGQK